MLSPNEELSCPGKAHEPMTSFKPLFCFIAALCSLAIRGQDCAGGRYWNEVFTGVEVTYAVPFGSNEAVAGGAQTLYMDVYEPSGDTRTDRPVVLVTFGGSFIAGNRADVAELCRSFAKRGFVAVSPDYRIGFFLPNSLSTTLAVLRGAHDMKACVRYLRSTVSDANNPYGIDPGRIIIGGISAGAVSALHAAYLDQEGEWPDVLGAQYTALGGVEGNSGSPGYPSDVLAVYSFSGALGDTTWMQPMDPPVCSVHETGDQVVPYYTEEVEVFGFPTGLIASGSHDVHLRADALGLDNCLLTYVSSGHVGYVDSDPITSIGFVMDFCADLVCGNEASCGNVVASVVGADAARPWNCYPNPAREILWIDGLAGVPVGVFNSTGQLVMEVRPQLDHQPVDLGRLEEGVYVLRAEGYPAQVMVMTR